MTKPIIKVPRPYLHNNEMSMLLTSSLLAVSLMQVMAPLCSFMASFMEVWPCRVTSHTRTCPSPPPLTSLRLLEVQARAVTP